jgi:hypothetical protein
MAPIAMRVARQPSVAVAGNRPAFTALIGRKFVALKTTGTSSETPAFLLFGSTASSEHAPGPFNMRNMTVNICAYSDRTSCNTAQNPTCGGAGGRGNGDVPRYKDIFVERIATTISATNGIAMNLVLKPTSNSSPPRISRLPMKVAVKWGNGMPSFVKRPTPWFATSFGLPVIPLG